MKNIFKNWAIRNNLEISDELFMLFKDKYPPLDRSSRAQFGDYVKTLSKLSDFSADEFIAFKTTNISIKASKGHESFIKNHTKEQVEERYRKSMSCGLETRRRKYPELSEKEAIAKSYIDGLITKGKRIAKLLDIEISDEADYVRLSGFTKHFNHLQLSDKDKKTRRIEWKKTCLLNPHVTSLLSISIDDIENFSDLQIEDMYSNYMSIRSTNNVLHNKIKGYGKSGYIVHNKSTSPLYYRSSLEKWALEYLQEMDGISVVDTEPYSIEYVSDKRHRYIPDIQVIDEKGKELLIEIKPEFKLKEFLETKYMFFSEEVKRKLIIISEKDLKQFSYFYAKINTYFKNC